MGWDLRVVTVTSEPIVESAAGNGGDAGAASGLPTGQAIVQAPEAIATQMLVQAGFTGVPDAASRELLSAALRDGWEPFAATIVINGNQAVWFRRPTRGRQGTEGDDTDDVPGFYL